MKLIFKKYTDEKEGDCWKEFSSELLNKHEIIKWNYMQKNVCYCIIIENILRLSNPIDLY